MKSPFTQAFPLIVARGLGLVVSFLIPMILVRIFTQAEFGIYKQVFLVYSTLFIVAQAGLAESLYYFVPQDPDRGGRYTINAMIGLTAAGLICLGALVGLGRLGGSVISPALAPHLPLVGLYLMLMLTSAVLEIAIMSRQRHALASLAFLVSDATRAAAYILPVLLVPRLEALLLGAVTFAAARVVVTLFYLRREYASDLRPDRSRLRSQLGYALPFAVAVVIEVLQANLHQYAVMSRFDPATFAIYAVGCLQIPLIDLVGSSVANIMMVSMTRARVEQRPWEVVTLWNETTRCLAMVFFPLVALMLVCSRDIIVALFTSRYAASTPIFMLWTLSVLGSVFQVDSVLRVHAQTRFIFILNSVRLALVAALIMPFLATWHLQGAVAASLVATFAGKALGLARIQRILRVPVSRLLPWRTLGLTLSLAAAAAAPAILVEHRTHESAWLALVATSVVYSGSYIALLLASGLVDASSFLARLGSVMMPFSRPTPANRPE